MTRSFHRSMALAGLMIAFGAAAAAQVRPIVHYTPAVVAGEGETAYVTALNVCEVPVHVRIQLFDGASGSPVGTPFSAVVDPQRTGQIDATLNQRSVNAQRVYARVEVSPGPGGAGPMINCSAVHGAPVIGQMEIKSPGGNTTTALLLPAVQKVREAASR